MVSVSSPPNIYNNHYSLTECYIARPTVVARLAAPRNSRSPVSWQLALQALLPARSVEPSYLRVNACGRHNSLRKSLDSHKARACDWISSPVVSEASSLAQLQLAQRLVALLSVWASSCSAGSAVYFPLCARIPTSTSLPLRIQSPKKSQVLLRVFKSRSICVYIAE